MSQKSVTFYPGKKQDSYPEDAIRLTKTALEKHLKKQMTLVFPIDQSSEKSITSKSDQQTFQNN